MSRASGEHAGGLQAGHHLVAALADLAEAFRQVGQRSMALAFSDHHYPFLGRPEDKNDGSGAGATYTTGQVHVIDGGWTN